MSSTNKTENLMLNSWIGSDKPKREDFNNDNMIIDSVVSGHIGDSAIHITQQERDRWNSLVSMGIYFGDGTVERTIELDVDFDVSFAIIYARNRPVSITRFSDSRNYNYVAFAGRLANSTGAKLGNDYRSIVVNQSASAVLTNEYANLNESGVAYAYILFR